MNSLDNALLAIRLCALDPGLGGVVLRGDGAWHEQVIAALSEHWPDGPIRRLPAHADDETLSGGLDLGATLASGRPVTRTGLLDAVAGGVLLIPLAERLAPATAGLIAQALDAGARFVAIAFDEGVEEETVPTALAERLAFRIELTPSRHPGFMPGSTGPGTAALTEDWIAAQGRHGDVSEADIVDVLAMVTLQLGIDSARAPQFALRALRAVAQVDGRDLPTANDLALAVRLVLAPRATQVPAEAPPPAPDQDPGDQTTTNNASQPLDDIVLAAARTAIPADVLARIATGTGRGRTGRGHGAGERRRSPTRGRPVGTRAGLPRGGLRLSLIDTLRAAAPWQKLRGRDGPRVMIRRDDLRIKRFEARAQATTIFTVDASGSAALARLAEAKGAVELLLGQAYVKRAQVALVAFRGATAETLLPPTRSLARARRLLGDLPGGGGTPLAAGLDAALDLALAAKARGQTPFVVVLTDGRANVARDGGRDSATSDAEAAARALNAAGIASAFVDISARPRPEGQRVASAMGARYLALPRADAHAMHAAIAAASR